MMYNGVEPESTDSKSGKLISFVMMQKETNQLLDLSGCTVLCTIHQPSSEVFELFDRLLLLALGEVIYHGAASDALRYYES